MVASIMQLRLFAVNQSNLLERLAPEPPTAGWLTDGRLRWFDIEGAPDSLVFKLLGPLGVEPRLFEGYREGTDVAATVERPNVLLVTHPRPSETGGGTHPSALHLACFENLLVTIRAGGITADSDAWYRRHIEGWPLASASIAALVHRIMESLADLERKVYLDIRGRTAQLGAEIRAKGPAFDPDVIEGLLNTVHEVSTFYFDQHLIFSSLQAIHTPAFSVGAEAERYRLSSLAADDISKGAVQLQGRLENLQQQFMLEVQAVTDRNIRILTILSAVFLPLTLISGIYGMNFQNMPELDESLAYPVVLILMGGIATGMMLFFYWRGWLD